jgi:glycosyltransferase involved in cell wall biosynthesis
MTPLLARSTTPLRVAFVDQVGATPGGAERNLAIFLAHAPATIAPLVVLFEDGTFANELRALGLSVAIVAAPSSVAKATRESGSFASLVAAIAMIGRVRALLREHRIDVVYTNSMKAHFIGGIAAWLARTTCVIHFHDLYTGLPLRALRLVARVVSRERIACSRMVAQTIGVGRTTAIYGPVDVAAFANLPDRATALARVALPGDLPIVALIGRVNRWKGHDRFLRIAQRVNERTAARFAIVGAPIFRDASFFDELHELANDPAQRGRIAFVPWLDDVRDVLAVVSVNTNCSTREPFGRAIPEAAAAGVPTVCFSDSGAAETIVDGVTGRTIAPGDEAGFADAIVAYLEDENARAKASAAARRFAESFDAAAIARQTAAVILRAAGRG